METIFGQNCLEKLKSCKKLYKEKILVKMLSKGLFWALNATPDQMTIPLNKLP